jgi:hypothetical protein
MLAFSTFVSFGITLPAAAQTPAAAAASPAEASSSAATPKTDASSALSSVSGAVITRPAAGAVNGLQLTASSGSNQASLNLGTSNPQGPNYSLLLSSPISTTSSSSGSSSGANANIATLDGLANGFAATGKVSWFSWLQTPKDGGPVSAAIVQKARLACAANPTPPDDAKACANKTGGPLVNAYGAKDATGRPSDYISYLEDHFQPNAAGLIAFTGGAQASVGYNSFAYYLPATLAKESQSDVPWSVGGHLGALPAWFGAPTLFDLSVNYQHAFSASPSGTQCKSVNAAITCQTGAFGAPKSQEKWLVALDANTQMWVPARVQWLGKFVGLSPQITYDAKSHEKGIDLPIYLIQDSKGNLIGGITPGWTSSQHLTIGLFVGAPFSFVK